MSLGPDNRWTDQQKTEHIKQVVGEAGQALRRRHPWLRHQDAIGAGILVLALTGMIGAGWAYVQGAIPAWLCIPLVALFASLTHELEHDLIHWMYFRGRPWAHHLMMALVWLARPSTINPWLRRGLHFEHHKYSGTRRDREERAVTNGERWSLARLLMTGDNVLALLLRLRQAPDWKSRRKLVLLSSVLYFPLGQLNWGLWHLFLGFHALDAVAAGLGHPIAWSAGTRSFMHTVDLLTVVWIAPNVLRTFCLHFVTSNMHYYGDVEGGNVMQQTQVLNPWWLWPLQLFCFNFGATHAIHHFVVKEPFYVRQWTASQAHAVMREMGLRFNDYGTFRRANRYALAARSEAAA